MACQPRPRKAHLPPRAIFQPAIFYASRHAPSRSYRYLSKIVLLDYFFTPSHRWVTRVRIHSVFRFNITAWSCLGNFSGVSFVTNIRSKSQGWIWLPGFYKSKGVFNFLPFPIYYSSREMSGVQLLLSWLNSKTNQDKDITVGVFNNEKISSVKCFSSGFEKPFTIKYSNVAFLNRSWLCQYGGGEDSFSFFEYKTI